MNARLIDRILACVVVLALAVPPLVPAQTPPAPAPFKAEELDQLAAPIALYPDPLVAQVLMASTYPLEIVQAARFVKDNPKLTGDPLNQALQGQTWDDSVKSLTTFPQVLSMMDSKLDWTQKLGDAFLAQQKELMEAIQRLRAKAQASGNLKSTAEQTVSVAPAAADPVPPPPPAPAQPQQAAPQQAPPQQVIVQQAAPTVITIVPANPQVIYVPTYNPTVVYGAWPYPAYPPYAYYPPGYVAGVGLFSFAAGVAVGSALWGNCNWGRGDVNVNVNQYNSYTKNVNNTNIANNRTQIQGGSGQNWQHNPEHRQGAQYRDSGTQQRYNRGANPQQTQARENFRGRAEQGRQDIARGGGPSSFQPSAQPRQQGGQQRPGGPGGESGVGQRQAGASQQPGGGGQRQASAAQQPARRPDAAAGQARGAGSGGGSAFQGMGQGREAQDFSNRGQSSRQSMSSAGGSPAQSRPSAAPSGGARSGGGGRGGGRR
jgi:hypothetical protein